VAPDWIWFTFVFALGCCIGSFLNVVIYRLPREKSLVHPGSACPACGAPIRFYDNIPLLSWLMLGGRCRQCKAPVSARYFVIEFITGVVFLGLFIVYFRSTMLSQMPPFLQGGWIIFLLHIMLLSAFIAASAIDLELWIIPLSICWFVTGAAFIGNAVAQTVFASVRTASSLLPVAGFSTGALALGGVLGLVVSLMLLATGLIKRSYEQADLAETHTANEVPVDDDTYNHRKEVAYEVVFLVPVVLGAVAAYTLAARVSSIHEAWQTLSARPLVSGLLGSVWGYLVGCAIVWGTRILGTFAFGKEAMGLGDVHLMGAAGAVIGAGMVTVAFFIAPFFGLGWALFQLFFKKTRQIPYGPFLSLGTLMVMIFHDWIMNRLIILFQGG